VDVAPVRHHPAHRLQGSRVELARVVEIEDRLGVVRLRSDEHDVLGHLGGARPLVAAHEEVLSHRAEAVGGQQRVPRAVARADRGGDVLDPEPRR
jgi:hypothetical protein